MFGLNKKSSFIENKLYNKIVNLSRNKYFYTKICLEDSFQNRINLIFIHLSFLFIKLKKADNKEFYKNFYQKMFDLTFNTIEANMRELGYGDVAVNKNMKFLVKTFYNVLLELESYKNKSLKDKVLIMSKYLEYNKSIKMPETNILIDYFDKYQAFCLDLSLDNVLKGDLEFNYK